MKKKAFTLVELIVVITILAILWTIAFISLSWYSKEARDSKRITDTSGLLSKINIEEVRWNTLDKLITNTRTATGQILWKTGSTFQTFWKANFKTLKEDEKNFRDPKNKSQNYPMAYTIWGGGKDAYKFIQVASVSEEKNRNIIKWNYYTLSKQDIPSLFYSGAFYTEKSDSDLIYEIEWINPKESEPEITSWILKIVYKVWDPKYGNWDLEVKFNLEVVWDYEIDWWDWNIEKTNTNIPFHEYNSDWEKEITITWKIKRFYNEYDSKTNSWKLDDYHKKIMRLEKWENITWTSMDYMFLQAKNLESIPNKPPSLNYVKSMSYMFSWAKLFNQDIWNWDIGEVENINAMFYQAINFNQNIWNWDMSNILNMSSMFDQATSFNNWETPWLSNSPLNWNTEKVINMTAMFHQATSFNQNIENWNTEKVESFDWMFHKAELFNQNIWNWNTNNLLSIKSMFDQATSFNN